MIDAFRMTIFMGGSVEVAGSIPPSRVQLA
jgi:hypothetical protein